MQSAVPQVLATLDRVHQPGRPQRCVGWARSAGFEQVSLDLIYGTPGETDQDWEQSVASALAAGAGSHLRLRADRRGRHPDGQADRAR